MQILLFHGHSGPAQCLAHRSFGSARSLAMSAIDMPSIWRRRNIICCAGGSVPTMAIMRSIRSMSAEALLRSGTSVVSMLSV